MLGGCATALGGSGRRVPPAWIVLLACLVCGGAVSVVANQGGPGAAAERQAGRRLLAGCNMGLFFENKCKYTTTIAVRARLAEDEAAGFCLDTPHSKGDWCMPALVSVAPGATTSSAMVQTDNKVFYYFAQATDDKGRTARWLGNTSDPETNWYDIKAGNMCKEGSADTCRPFKQLNATTCSEKHTRTLTCDKLIDCSIANCQTYDSRMSVCECDVCKPGYWGSQCSPCDVPNCQSYFTTGECVCGTCASGYQLQSGGGCAKVECNVPHCQSYSDGGGCSCAVCAAGYRLASAQACDACGVASCESYSAVNECSCSQCATGYRASNGACLPCAVSNCTSYSAASGDCACSTCASGYQLSGGSCVPVETGGGGNATTSSSGTSSSNTAMIAGVAAGAVAAVAVLGALGVYAYHRRHRRQQAADHDTKGGLDSLVIPPTGGAFGGGGDDGAGPGHYSWAAGAAQNASATPAGSSLGTGSEQLEVAVYGRGTAAGAAATAAANRGLGPLPFVGTELSTLPSVVEDVDDGLTTLAPIPTCPAGTPPMSLASLQAATVGAAAGTALRPPEARSTHSSTGTSPRSSLLPPGLPAPPTTSVPSRAGYSSARSGGTASALLSRDPLMTYLHSHVPHAAAASHTSSQPRSPGTPGGVDVRPWEVRFDDLEIIRPAGEGSFGKVYLANYFATQVAVKVLLVGHVASASDAERALTLSTPILQKLEAEASLLASLRHPHIVNFLGVCHDPPAIVTEFCERGSLAEVLAAARGDPQAAAELTWARRLTMACHAAAGMLYLHTRPLPIVHRDLKSPNLLVDSNFIVKVSDFNLSKALEGTTQSSSLAAMNPRWLAPEVMRGQRASKASDVYSFGIVMHELLTWQLPWGAANPWQLAGHVMAGGRLEVPPREALPGPDTEAFGGLDDYIALMKSCWAQEPGERPGFEDIVPHIRALLEQAPGA